MSFVVKSTTSPVSHISETTLVGMVALGVAVQVNEKLTLSIFPQRQAQFEALLIGYDLMDYVTGDF